MVVAIINSRENKYWILKHITNLPYLKQFGAGSGIHNYNRLKNSGQVPYTNENVKCDMGGISNQWGKK